MIVLRDFKPANVGERAFVARSWVESFAESTMAKLVTFAGLVPDARAGWNAGPGYWRTWNGLVNGLVDRAHILVAEDDGLIAGFACWEPWGDGVALHYVYVRASYRRRGVARDLLAKLPAGPVVFTHRSRGVRTVPESWRYSLAPLLMTKEAA